VEAGPRSSSPGWKCRRAGRGLARTGRVGQGSLFAAAAAAAAAGRRRW